MEKRNLFKRIADRLKTEWETIRSKKFKDALKYIWRYRKTALLIIVLLIAAVVSCVRGGIRDRNEIMFLVAVESGQTDYDTWFDGLTEYFTLNKKSETALYSADCGADITDTGFLVLVNSTLTYGGADLCICNLSVLDYFISSDFVDPVEDMLDSEDYEGYSEYLYYREVRLVDEDGGEVVKQFAGNYAFDISGTSFTAEYGLSDEPLFLVVPNQSYAGDVMQEILSYFYSE